MVQVDVFWSYAIGAGCGAAAAHAAAVQPVRQALTDRRLTATVLFLACVFAPSGIWLLWRYTGWETMHVAAAPHDLPGWLVAAFAVTNVTQGVLGYLAAQALWRRGHRYLAWLQMPLGYLAMFFILVHGWDGTGYRRFLSSTGAWRDGAVDVPGFLESDVALTLYGMGAVLVPLLLWLQAGWWSRGHAPAAARSAALILLAVFGLGLGLAVAAAALLTVLGPAAGVAAVAVLLTAALHRRGPAGWLARGFPLDDRPPPAVIGTGGPAARRAATRTPARRAAPDRYR